MTWRLRLPKALKENAFLKTHAKRLGMSWCSYGRESKILENERCQRELGELMLEGKRGEMCLSVPRGRERLVLRGERGRGGISLCMSVPKGGAEQRSGNPTIYEKRKGEGIKAMLVEYE